jgi:glycosyltransferase involved in cell wall biosynthesis
MKQPLILVDGYHAGGLRGFSRYVREFLGALAAGGGGVAVALPARVSRNAAVVEVLRASGMRVLVGPDWPLPLWEQICMPYLAWRLGADLVHAPAGTRALVGRGGRIWACTLHDVLYLEPQAGYGLRQRLGAVYRRLASPRGPAPVVTVSRHAASAIKDRLGTPAANLGQSVDRFLAASGSADPWEGTPGKPYLLHVGWRSPHKNTARVLRAYAAYRQAGGDCALVVMGCSGGGAVGVHDCPPLSDAGLLALMSGATALVFPSLAEGFGLPILESMALGTPVITSRRPPMDEVAGRAAELVDPENEAEIAAAMARISKDEDLRRRLRTAGLQRAAWFSGPRLQARARRWWMGVLAVRGWR